MIRRLLALVIAIGLIPVTRAHADDTTGGSGKGVFWVEQVENASGKTSASTTGEGDSRGGPAIVLGSSGCPGAEQVIEGSNATDATFCQQYAEPATPVLTVGLIRNAFAELELPAGTLVIQPPDGLTLVNFDTNFYTTSTAPIARTVTLLGRRVTLEATPSTFHWSFGDGERLSTSDPGAPYPALRVTHNYLAKGSYRPALGTTYTGRYRVGGGPWRQIPGTVTINGTGQALRAIEAQPKLVSY